MKYLVGVGITPPEGGIGFANAIANAFPSAADLVKAFSGKMPEGTRITIMSISPVPDDEVIQQFSGVIPVGTMEPKSEKG